MNFSDLIKDFTTGGMSHSKLWANVAYATVTGSIIYKVYVGNASDDLLLYYLGIVALHATGSKYVGNVTDKG